MPYNNTYTVSYGSNATTTATTNTSDYTYNVTAPVNNYIFIPDTTTTFDYSRSRNSPNWVSSLFGEDDKINQLKCINIYNVKYKNEFITVPEFNFNTDERIIISVGVFASNNFSHEFTKEEFNERLIEFANNFIEQLRKDNLLKYDYIDNKIILYRR